MNTWMGGGLPPLADGYLKGFFTHYMDPIEENARIYSLAAEFPDLAEIIDLPYKTNGYQRKSMAIMTGTTARSAASLQSAQRRRRGRRCSPKRWARTRRQRHPGRVSQPRRRQLAAHRVGDGHRGSPSTWRQTRPAPLTSTAAAGQGCHQCQPGRQRAGHRPDVEQRPGSRHRAAARPGQPVRLPERACRVSAGPDRTCQLLRIGKHRDGSKVGVFLYCQQHAREWTTSLSCVETAERLLRNYAIDPDDERVRRQPRHLHRPEHRTRTARSPRTMTTTASART